MDPPSFANLSEKELETIADALKGTSWLAVFSRLSKQCKAAATRVEDPAALRRLKVCDVVASVELAEWARTNGCPWDTRTCAAAAKGGNLEVLQWLRANGCPWDGKTHYCAAMKGHVDVLKWARANGCPWETGGNIPKTRSNIHKRCPCYAAARQGRLDILQWLLDNECPWKPSFILRAAAEGGHLEVLEWLDDNGCEFLGTAA